MNPVALYDVPAPAKLNLFLHVVGRRADGYHLLESAFVLIDWSDTLHFERRDDGQLSRHDLTEPLPADDLCLRAARALQAASGCQLGADISVAKHIPSGAGMGGGSSDAATVLLALNRLWGLGWPRQRLLELAQTLGADVPFFVYGQNALAQGTGEQLSPLALPPQAYAVVKPQASIATASIFGSPLLKRDTASVILMGSLESTVLAGLAQGFGRNDLQPPAESACPEVVHALELLKARFGNSRMTGSGSAVFARVGAEVPPKATRPEGQAGTVFDDVPLPDGWVGRWCHSLPEHPLRGWAS
jgi:4-diphosphocytidyl-2-C-methyl-D-erythritol kinase